MASCDMTITLFGVWHWAILLIAALLITGIALLLRCLPEKGRWLLLRLLAVGNLLLYIVRTFRISQCGWFNIWEELPLHLCGLSLFVELLAALLRRQTLLHFSLFVSTFGGLIALAVPTHDFLDTPLFASGNITFYLQHTLLVGFGVWILAAGFLHLRLSYLLKADALLVVIAAVCHIINLLIRHFALGNADYLFTMDPYGNPLLCFLYGLIPVPFLYLLPVLPLLLVLQMLLYLPLRRFPSHR